MLGAVEELVQRNGEQQSDHRLSDRIGKYTLLGHSGI